MLEKVEKELKTEFIPELYDKAMHKMYGDKYYEMSEDGGEDDLSTDKQKKINIKLMRDDDNVGGDDDDNEDPEEGEVDEAEEERYERELAKSLKDQVKKRQEMESESQQYDTWFACD